MIYNNYHYLELFVIIHACSLLVEVFFLRECIWSLKKKPIHIYCPCWINHFNGCFSIIFTFYPAISTFAVQICYTNKCLLYSQQTNKLFSLRINFPGTLQLCTAEGADKYETGTNVTRTAKKTPLTTFMKGEE